MYSTIRSLRMSIVAGAVLLAGGALHSARAAEAGDVAVQRVAMACMQGSDAAACKPAPMQVRPAAAQRVDKAAPKASMRNTHVSANDAHDLDGSRFTYDSCGCSN